VLPTVSPNFVGGPNFGKTFRPSDHLEFLENMCTLELTARHFGVLLVYNVGPKKIDATDTQRLSYCCRR